MHTNKTHKENLLSNVQLSDGCVHRVYILIFEFKLILFVRISECEWENFHSHRKTSYPVRLSVLNWMVALLFVLMLFGIYIYIYDCVCVNLASFCFELRFFRHCSSVCFIWVAVLSFYFFCTHSEWFWTSPVLSFHIVVAVFCIHVHRTLAAKKKQNDLFNFFVCILYWLLGALVTMCFLCSVFWANIAER